MDLFRSTSDLIENAIQDEKEVLSNKKKEKEKIYDHLVLLKKFTYSYYLRHYVELSSNMKTEVDRLKGKIQSTDRRKKWRDSRYKTLIDEFRDKMGEVKDLYFDLTELIRILLPSDEKHHIDIWSRITFDNVIKDLYFDKDLKLEIKDIRSIIKERSNDKERRDAIIKAELYSGLIDFLKKYSMEGIEIPGIKKSVTELISILQKNLKEYEEIIKFSQNVKKTLENLDKIEEEIKYVEGTILPQIKKVKKSRSEEFSTNEFDEISDELGEKQDRLDSYLNKMDYYSHEFLKLGLKEKELENIIQETGEIKELQKYNHYTEDQLREKISNLNTSLTEIESNITESKIELRMDEEELNRLKNQKEHKYQSKKDLLDKMFEKIKLLQKKFTDNYSNYILAILNNEAKSSDLDKDQLFKIYCDKLFYYIGNKVGYVRYGEKNYKIKNIDLIEDFILTEEGKKILLVDMGTGHSQGAYLQGLLNTNDDRKIIAFFDEVGMMDEETLAPIFKIFRELYQANRLIAAIVVQKETKKIKITSNVSDKEEVILEKRY